YPTWSRPAMTAPKIVWKNTKDLRPHRLNARLYGPPTANSRYKDIKLDMERRGFDERFPLFVTEDGRIVHGVTRWAAAKAAGLGQVPCLIFTPSNPATAELEFEREIVKGNIQRDKTQEMIAREQERLLEIETDLAHQRMAAGGAGGLADADKGP